MKIGKLALAFGVILALAGCSTVSNDSVASNLDHKLSTDQLESSSPTPSSVVETSDSLPPVSLGATCQLLFSSDISQGPMGEAVGMLSEISAPGFDHTQISESDLEDVIEPLKTAHESAGEDIEPYIGAVIKPLEEFLEVKQTGGSINIDLSNFKVAGTEIITQCEPYLI